ncbi:TPA: hypothetical protein U2D46_001935 [Streptococcus suis]|uniref:hypothetical protein n=1 Tax=Streptococcus suis TaxID=1307 RepID=UPI001583E6B2|nr:hypothetical protein [Streptococcus suis]MCK3890750.1 hypothetical protein [Streptococcus suis]HEM6456077.1 hypothetical protein [Streptococcus suis]HEM6472795.1 hypothetical protein [Streptococcus suis]
MKWELRENLVWQRAKTYSEIKLEERQAFVWNYATQSEKEGLLDAGLVCKSRYIRFLNKLTREIKIRQERKQYV